MPIHRSKRIGRFVLHEVLARGGGVDNGLAFSRSSARNSSTEKLAAHDLGARRAWTIPTSDE